MKSRFLPLVVAFALAVIAAISVFLYVGSTENRVLAQQQTTQVYVTAQQVPTGQTLQSALDTGLLRLTDVPADRAPVGAVTKIDVSNGAQMAIADLPPGQVVFAQAFSAEQPDTSPLSVPAGKAAVTVELADPARVGSFLRPGSQIAVFATIEDPQSKAKTTKLVLDRVSVLAVGPTTSSDETTEGDPQASALITVAVDQLQAEKLIHGAQTGSLYLALLDQNTNFTNSNGVSDATITSKGTP